jgi:hypothetical protein
LGLVTEVLVQVGIAEAMRGSGYQFLPNDGQPGSYAVVPVKSPFDQLRRASGFDGLNLLNPRFRELRLYSSCKGLFAKVEVVAKGNQ